jgi:hypothetical protein
MPGKARLPHGPTEQMEQDALDKLEVTREDVANVPAIGHILKSAAVDPWPYLEGSEDVNARRLIATRRKMTLTEFRHSTIEAICLSAGVPTKQALSVIMAEVFQQSGRAAELLYAANHQGVVQATIDNAKTPFGASDRKLLLQHQGFAPVPKTNIVKIFGGQNVLGGAQTNQTAVLAPMEDKAKRLQDRFNERLGLPPTGEMAQIEAPEPPEDPETPDDAGGQEADDIEVESGEIEFEAAEDD